MKKLLAVLLSIMMLAMPLTSMAENSVWDNAARQETTITIHDLNADLVAALGGDDTAMAAINDLLAALSLTGSTITLRAQLYQSTTPNNIFSRRSAGRRSWL